MRYTFFLKQSFIAYLKCTCFVLGFCKPSNWVTLKTALHLSVLKICKATVYPYTCITRAAGSLCRLNVNCLSMEPQLVFVIMIMIIAVIFSILIIIIQISHQRATYPGCILLTSEELLFLNCIWGLCHWQILRFQKLIASFILRESQKEHCSLDYSSPLRGPCSG